MTLIPNEFLKHLNTVLITLVLGVSIWVLGEISRFRKDQRDIEIGFAIANQILIDHIEDSNMWIGIIQELADQKHPATQSRYTQADALKDKDALRRELYRYMDRYYQKKKE